MAILYKHHAILSVGMSRQAAKQIEAQKPLLDSWMGETGTHFETPFDWLVLAPRAAAECLHRGDFFPERAEQLRRDRSNAYHWAERDVWLAKLAGGLAGFEARKASFVGAAKRLDALKGRKTLAIWTNAQKNLERIGFDASLDITARQSDLARLEHGLQRKFDDVSLFSVVRGSREDKHDPVDPTKRAYYYADPDNDTWRGDADVWSDVLYQAFAKTGFAPARAQETTEELRLMAS